jgi:hypothetical protein
MKSIFAAAIFVAVPMAFATATAASAGAASASCQPLTSDNLQACCDDPRWSTLIQPQDHQFCSRRNAQDDVRLGRKLKSRSGQTSADTDVTGSVDKPGTNGSVSSSSGNSDDDDGAAGSNGNGNDAGNPGVGNTGNGNDAGNPGVGNPGNGKDVGNAGEKGMDHGDSPKGTRGNSN